MSKSERRNRIIDIVAGLPEATYAGNRHLTFAIRGKTFGYYLDDHHGDGITGLSVKAAVGEQEALIESNLDRFYVPAYVGAKGWVALRLDLVDVDWGEVGELLTEAYRLQAPRRLAARLDV